MSWRTRERKDGSKYRYPLLDNKNKYVPTDLYIQEAEDSKDELSCEDMYEKIIEMRRILREDFGGTASGNPKARDLLGEIAMYEEALMRRCPDLYNNYLREMKSKQKIKNIDQDDTIKEWDDMGLLDGVAVKDEDTGEWISFKEYKEKQQMKKWK